MRGYCPAHVWNVRRALDLIRGYCPVLCGNGDQDLRQGSQTGLYLPATPKSHLRAGGLGNVRFFQEPGYGGSQRGGGLRRDKRLLSLSGLGRAGKKKQASERSDTCSRSQRGAGIFGNVAAVPKKAHGKQHLSGRAQGEKYMAGREGQVWSLWVRLDERRQSDGGSIPAVFQTLTGANAVLLSYANGKIEKLDTHRQTLIKTIAEMSAETMSPGQAEPMSAHLDNWQNIDFEDRRQVADGLISQIRATCDHVSIEWKI